MPGRLALLACAFVLGCVAPPRRLPECTGPLVPTTSMGPDFVARERLHLVHAERVVRLDLVLQKRGDTLVLVGFDPLGPKLFSLVQRGLEVEVDAKPSAVLPVPPRNVLRDVQHARFGMAPSGVAGPGVAAPEVSVTREGERVVVRNAACGSVATFTTVSQRSLP